MHTMADLASRPQNIEYLNDAGALDLLRPLLSDVMPTIQHTAAVALGRMANHDSKIAQAIVSRDILPLLLQSINKQNVRIQNFTSITLLVTGGTVLNILQYGRVFLS